jgi:hypothetical protein
MPQTKAPAPAPNATHGSHSEPAEPETWKEFIARKGSKPVSYVVFGPLYDVVVDALKQHMTRLDALETRVAAFEQKPHVKFCGVWKAGTTYSRGDAAVHQGSLWICKVATPGEPSKDFVGWQLAVKRGSL